MLRSEQDGEERPSAADPKETRDRDRSQIQNKIEINNPFFITNKQEYNRSTDVTILPASIKNVFLTEHVLYPKNNPTRLSSNSVKTTQL
jgi:hypothetical protein